MDSVKIEIRGLPELRRAFKDIDAGLPNELKSHFKAIAEKVAGRARSKATADFKNPSGKAVGSIKARASTRNASIVFGGQAAEYYPWLDFGGSVGRGHRQFSGKGIGGGAIKRRVIPGGRYVYPAIAEQSEEIKQAAEDAVNDVARKARFETRSGI